MKPVQLGDVAKFIRGITFKPDDIVELGTDGSVACLRTKNVQADLDLSDVWAVSRNFVKSDEKLTKPGDIILSTANSWNLVGKASWIPELPWPTTAGGFVSLLRANPEKVSPRYLYHWITTDEAQANLRKCARQTTNISNLNIQQAAALKIPLPPLAEQKRIATILDQADALRRLRARALEKLNTLGQAVFQEMFGNPSTNPKNWKIGTIGDLLSAVNYGTSAKANTDGRGMPILRMGNVTYDGRLDLSDMKHIELETRDVDKYTTKPGDILFNRTNSKELVGKTTVIRQAEPLAFAGYLVRARVNSDGNPDYISAYLNSRHGKATLTGMCKNIVGMANINAKEMQRIKIALPPRELQDQYSVRLDAIEPLRTSIETSGAKLSTLFAALQHRAFRGEL